MFLEYVALFMLVFVALVMFYGIIAIHDIPYEIAVKRNHPHQDVLHVAGWVSLFTLLAAFRQNSALRLKAGYEAEIVYPSIPGRVFKGKVVSVLPNMAEGQLQTSGILIGTEAFQRIGRVPVVIEVLDDMSEYNLSTGSRAQVAVYSDHFHHVAIMRKILLRMSSWQNYLYLDH